MRFDDNYAIQSVTKSKDLKQIYEIGGGQPGRPPSKHFAAYIKMTAPRKNDTIGTADCLACFGLFWFDFAKRYELPYFAALVQRLPGADRGRNRLMTRQIARHK
jgi:hypothetical protein